MNIKQSEKIRPLINLDHYFKEINSLCSYLAMFPSEVPEKYIKKFTKKGDIVYDPFSGRGTTTLQAIKHERVAISNDLSPLAFVLTKAKTFSVNLREIISRVNDLETQFKNWDKKIDFNDKKFEEISIFYSERNLKQIFFLREKIGKNWKELNHVDNYILAIALGIAHGPTRKNGENNSLYFSVNMANGYSMAPNYAKKYIEKNNLKKIETNVFEQIIYRAKIKDPSNLEPNPFNNVFNTDATKSSEIEIFKNGVKPKLIFTSPPYLNLIKYVEQNWIRFWILGFEKMQTKGEIVDDYHKEPEYIKFLVRFMIDMEKIMDQESVLILVIGDVNNHLIKNMMKTKIIPSLSKQGSKLKQKGKVISQQLKNKTSRQMGNRVGQATSNDYIFKFELEKK